MINFILLIYLAMVIAKCLKKNKNKLVILLKNITKKYKKLPAVNGELKQKIGCFFDRSVLDGISWKKYNIHNI